MKVVFVVAALFVAAALYCLNDFSKISAPILAHIVQQEGGVDAVQRAAQQDGFASKYKGFLDERYYLARVATVLDDDAMMTLANDTYARYNNTPLQSDPDFGFILLRRALLLDDRQAYQDAGDLFEQYLSSFPQGDGVPVAESAVSSLRINHGIQVGN